MSLSAKPFRSGVVDYINHNKLASTNSIALWTATALSLATFSFLAFTIAPDLAPRNAFAAENDSEMAVSVEPMASIALETYDPATSTWVSSNNLNMTVNPGTFNTAVSRVTVSTNSPGGLKLSLNDSDSQNALVEQNDTPSSPTKPIIPSITSDITIDNATDSTNKFTSNKWGYNVTQTTPGSSSAPTVPLTYSSIPTSEQLIVDSSDTSILAYNFTIGSRIDGALPAGIYEDQVTFTVIANPIPDTRTIFDITSMQDMIPVVCENTTTPLSSATNLDTDGSHAGDTSYVPSTTLTDERDNQQYTVRKLADGNCWMSENLRYGVNPDGTGHPFVATDAALSNSGLDATKMLDLTYDSTSPNTAGRIKNGDSGMKTADNSANAFDDEAESYIEPYINIYQANNVADYDGQTKYGVMYNYCAATGGTSCTDSSIDYNPTGSVCPKGWELPGMTDDPTGSGTGTTDGSVKTYDNVLSLYSVSDSSTGFDIVVASPFSFVRSGRTRDGSLSNRSSSGNGYYWSSTKHSSTNYAYFLYFYSGHVNQNSGSRYRGNSVRCVSES